MLYEAFGASRLLWGTGYPGTHRSLPLDQELAIVTQHLPFLLEDDKGMFPPYNSTFLMKKSTADAAGPDLAATIAAVNKNLTADVMQELNARVDLDKDTPEQAAQAYLKQFKLIPS